MSLPPPLFPLIESDPPEYFRLRERRSDKKPGCYSSQVHKLVGSAPVLLVADVQQAAHYYRDKLGFKFERFWGDPPSFCMPARDGLIVMLSQVPANHPVDTEWRRSDRVWNAYFGVDDAKALHDEWAGRGASIECGLSRKPYGILEFQYSGSRRPFHRHRPTDRRFGLMSEAVLFLRP